MTDILLSEYMNSVTSDGQIADGPVRNMVSEDTGLVTNMEGSRNILNEFFRTTYSLDEETSDSESVRYDGDISIGMATSVVDLIVEQLPRQAGLNVLDVGCGKGLVLRTLVDRLVSPVLTGIEPNEAAKKRIVADPKLKQVCLTVMDEVIEAEKKFDLIILNNVLEHVPDPIDFLKRISSLLASEGILFVGVPNFANNPIDLLTFDHLSRFTPRTLCAIFETVNLLPIRRSFGANQVSMDWIVKRRSRSRSTTGRTVGSVIEELEGARRNQRWLDECIEEIPNRINLAKGKTQPVVIYGTANLWPGLIALGRSQEDDVNHIVDDNESRWGSRRWGRVIESPEYVFQQVDQDPLVIISANPCYFELISLRVQNLTCGNHSIYRAETSTVGG